MKESPAQAPLRAQHERAIPADLWHRCSRCRTLVYARHWSDSAGVCPSCGHHAQLAADQWTALLLDSGSWHEHDADLAPADPLNFVALQETYAHKLTRLQLALGRLDAAICGTGTIEGLPLALCVHDFGFMGGSMGSVVGEKVARSAERAATLQIPLVTVNASGGARMHEGMVSLMQMAKVAVALARLGEAGQPHIAVLIDPCYGGVTAAHASLADVIIAEPGAHIGFAGPRVIEQTTRQTLPPNFQTAEFMLDHGMVDMVTPRPLVRTLIGRLLRLYAGHARIESQQPSLAVQE